MNSGLGRAFIHLIVQKPLLGAGITETKLAAHAYNCPWVVRNFVLSTSPYLSIIVERCDRRKKKKKFEAKPKERLLVPPTSTELLENFCH